MPLQVAVIGAGIAGLSAAIGLRRAGHGVVVSHLYALRHQTNLPDIRTIPL
jgi:thioredoxin reductase